MAAKLYTAIGRFKRRSDGCGRSCPVIILSGKEFMVDMQEMIIWTQLNWRLLKPEEIQPFYDKAVAKTGFSVKRSCEDCVNRLLVRGLIVSGSGETEYEALYDLLNGLYIIPATGTAGLRFLSFLKLTLWNHVSLSAAKKLFRRDHRTPGEEQVMALAKQALLSTAEIIKCVEKDIRCLPTNESILTELYDDDDTTSDNIGSLVRSSVSTEPVMLAVANLYLRQQIIFERI